MFSSVSPTRSLLCRVRATRPLERQRREDLQGMWNSCSAQSKGSTYCLGWNPGGAKEIMYVCVIAT